MTDRVAIVTGASGGIGHAGGCPARAGGHGRGRALRRQPVTARRRWPTRSSPPAAARSSWRADVADEEQVAAMFDAGRGRIRRHRRRGQHRRHHVAVAADRAEPRRLRPDAPHQRARHLRREPAGRAPGAQGRRHHQLLDLGHQDRRARLHRLRRDQGRRRRDDADPRQGDARPRRHRQRRRTRARPPPRCSSRARRRRSSTARRRPSPLERLGEPEDIAEAVAFLAGPARWVNGQVIHVNGGVIS